MQNEAERLKTQLAPEKMHQPVASILDQIYGKKGGEAKEMTAEESETVAVIISSMMGLL